MKRIGSWIWGKFFVLFFRPLYALENSRSLWPVVNRKAVSHFKKYGRVPTAPESRIIDDLRANGIAISSLDELFGNGARLLEELRSYNRALESSGRVHPVKPYVMNFFDDVPFLNMNNPFVRLSLDERVLTIAGHYLGMSPKLQEFTLAEIKQVPPGTEKIGSMRWHRDPNDYRLTKMFIYLTDVGPRNGPFSYVKSSNAGNRYAKVFPQVPPAGVYPPHGEVEKRVDQKDIFAAGGKAGTVVFADTAGLHGGGYVLEGARRMSTFGYLPPKSFLVRILKFIGNTETLGPLQQYAVTGSEYLFSREIYKTMRTLLEGKKSLGTHITGMQQKM